MPRSAPTAVLPLPAGLRLRWWGAVLAGACVVGGGYLLLAARWRPADALVWLLTVCALHVYVFGYLRYHLRQNHRPEEGVVLPTLGPGNTLTLARGLLAGLLGGFLFLPRPPGWLGWLPGLLFLAIGLADFWDGYLARVSDQATRLGEKMDVAFDAFATLLATALVVRYGQLPGWYLSVGVVYYLFVGLLALRRRLGRPVYALPPSPYRRVIGGFLFGYLAVVLFPVFEPPGTVLAGVLFALPVAFSFGRDWLVSVGWVDATAVSYHAGMARLRALLLDALPVGLRGLVGVGGGSLLYHVLLGSERWGDRLAQLGFAAPEAGAALLGAFGAAMIVLIGLGAAGRLAALGLLAVACADLLLRGFDGVNAVVLAGSISVLLLGTGAYSCWRPEEIFLLRRAGEARARPRAYE